MPTTTEERARLRAMFEEYRRTGDRRLRNELIEAHQQLVLHLARRFANRGEPFDDLVQVAHLGILKAVERFDPSRELEFSTFATATVEGELKRHFRDATWAVRVPRRPQELHLRLRSTTEELAQRLQRTPTLTELAEALGVGEEQVLEAMEAGGAYRSTSLGADRADGPADLRLERRLGEDESGYELTEIREVLRGLLDELPERERTIVYLRFFEDMTQTEIAAEIGISQMHVSRLLARTLGRLRTRFEEA
jgi:RNA polymerase sigma-B factor